tara:strand:- start:81 stop:1313 length:1233 start_codon:yes stop_codon:yes gene_type:complete
MAFSAQPIISVLFLFTLFLRFVFRILGRAKITLLSLILLLYLVYVFLNGIFQESFNITSLFSLNFFNNEGRIFLAYIPFLYFLNYKKKIITKDLNHIIQFVFLVLLLVVLLDSFGINTFSGHHYEGSFYSFALVLFSSIAIFHSKISVPPILPILAMAISFYGLLMANSRGALLGVFPALLFLFFFLSRKNKILVSGFSLIFLMVISSYLAYINPMFFQKLLVLTEIFNENTPAILLEQSVAPIDKKPSGTLDAEYEISGIWNIIQRFRYWYIGIILFAESPVFGIGLGGFDNFPHKIIFDDYGTYLDTTGYATSVVTPHNGVLTILVEQGLIGLMIISTFFILLLTKSFKKILNIQYTHSKLMNISFIAYFLVFLTHSLTNSAFNAPGHLIPLSLMFFLANSLEIVDED